jgi:hypothetical protein
VIASGAIELEILMVEVPTQPVTVLLTTNE